MIKYLSHDERHIIVRRSNWLFEMIRRKYHGESYPKSQKFNLNAAKFAD